MGTYVMQVRAGSEQRTLRLLERRIADRLSVELAFPLFRVQKKIKGTWQVVEKPLTPGYLYATTAQPEELNQLLHEMPGMARMLLVNGRIIPLSSDEEDWLNTLTGEDHVVEPSVGVVVGDHVVVNHGPLCGMESRILRIDRHKRFAYIGVRLLGRLVTIQVGLEIVAKIDEPERRDRRAGASHQTEDCRGSGHGARR